MFDSPREREMRMNNTIKVSICLITALALIAVSLVGCNVQSNATEPTGSEQTNNSLETTRGPTEGTTDVPTTTTKPGSTTVTMPETTGPNDVDTTEPTTKPVDTTVPTDPIGTTAPVGTTEPTETTAPVETTVPPVTEPPVTTTPPVTTQPSVPVTTGHTHRYTETVVTATCSTKGYTHHECSCGESYDDSETAALGHDYGSAVVAPTCTADGYTKHVCSRCGDSYTDASTNAAGHSWGEWTVIREPSISLTGRELRSCNVCKISEYRETEKLDEETATALVAEKFLAYINQFRVEQGSTELIYLPGMTQVAQYRSQQLVTNFAHDTKDKREALAYYKYGTLLTPGGWDPSEYYYEADTKEAISMTNLKGSPDEVALEFANACRNSKNHWAYVGSSEYSYAGVGVTYIDGKHYLCIMVGGTNYG